MGVEPITGECPPVSETGRFAEVCERSRGKPTGEESNLRLRDFTAPLDRLSYQSFRETSAGVEPASVALQATG